MKKVSPLQFTPIGGGREIGANSYLIELEGHRILLDCGIHPKKEGPQALPDFSLLREAPEAVLISHAHVDHCGAVPELLRRFRETVPYSTPATLGVMDCMLHNSVSVMGTIARERNVPGYPLYTHEDVEYAVESSVAVGLDEEFSVCGNGDLVGRLRHAGHVLGSASILLRADGHTLFYTGDICDTDQELMAGLDPLDEAERVDTLIIESTYGANLDADQSRYQEQADRFCRRIGEVLTRGGSVLVPAFALGRTQEMLNIIARYQDNGELPPVPVYASGLGRAVYEVYNRYPDYLHPEAELRPLSRFGRVGDVWNRDNVQDLLSEPAIIVATSGMMVENTPSALIAEEMVQGPHHGLFFVGYVDPETLGYRVLHAKKGMVLHFGPSRPAVKVTLENIAHFHFSAHAPRSALHEQINRLNPRNVIFVHGDPEAIDWMYDQTGNGRRKFCSPLGETIELD
ncbi:MAG: MBL fold metallo-hydrolase [Candidatus Hydrogenedentes bacterium]|nr:MBL fold metallo-hydrolase [Candidatus Hydrogenedentota bacterium]